ncbi:uncharacterized protein LOC142518517 isoform X1 [Primulina tabacum]|uniref:uncharacterized protein LOC142518517 isoform X1 n=1 Tax=Primulina tabacum TaxID=48773 RepID=UPI003F599C07
MESLTRLLRRTRNPNPNGAADGGEGKPTAVETAASSRRETVSAKADGDCTACSDEVGRNKRALMGSPPSDDVCPICFGSFDVPCRAPCGHWFCGGCILQYWNFSSALLQCKCPMCSQHISKLMPEASLYCRTEAEVRKVLKDVGDYNRLFVGGISGIVLKLTAIPLYIKRMFRDLLNPDRPGLHLHELRLIAMFLGIVYSFGPFDFLHIGRRHIIDVFDYSAFTLSFIFYLAGLYLRRQRVRNVRELAGIQARQD